MSISGRQWNFSGWNKNAVKRSLLRRIFLGGREWANIYVSCWSQEFSCRNHSSFREWLTGDRNLVYPQSSVQVQGIHTGFQNVVDLWEGTIWEKRPKTAWRLQNPHFGGKTVGDMGGRQTNFLGSSKPCKVKVSSIKGLTKILEEKDSLCPVPLNSNCC